MNRSPVRILQLVPALEQGGVERGVVEMNRALIASGRENIVVSAGGRLAVQIEADGGKHITLEVKSKNPFTYFLRAWRLRKVLETVRPTVVCVHSRVPAWLFVWANRTLRIPWISFAHGANSISRYSRIMTAGDLTVTPSRYVADYLKAAYGLDEKKLRVIPRAVENDRFNPAALDLEFMETKRAEWGLEGHYVVMALGRITQLKGYDTLIQAMADESMPSEAKLVIVGEAETRRKEVEAKLHAMTHELGLEERVVFAGNQRKVAECLSLSNVVVSSNTRKPEAFGRSMAEALVMNRPVVACAFGGALDIVLDGVNGALVSPNSKDMPRAFAAAIKRVHDSFFGDLRTAALEKFSFKRMAATAIAVYEELGA